MQLNGVVWCCWCYAVLVSLVHQQLEQKRVCVRVWTISAGEFRGRHSGRHCFAPNYGLTYTHTHALWPPACRNVFGINTIPSPSNMIMKGNIALSAGDSRELAWRPHTLNECVRIGAQTIGRLVHKSWNHINIIKIIFLGSQASRMTCNNNVSARFHWPPIVEYGIVILLFFYMPQHEWKRGNRVSNRTIQFFLGEWEYIVRESNYDYGLSCRRNQSRKWFILFL